MKTKISETEAKILTAAFDIIQDIDNRLWQEYFEDTKDNGYCKFHGKTHRAAKISYSISHKMHSLFLLMDIIKK